MRHLAAHEDRFRSATVAKSPTPDLPELIQQSLSSNVRKGAVWVVASNLLLRVTNVSITAVVAHILAPRDFGVFAVAVTAYTIVSGSASSVFQHV